MNIFRTPQYKRAFEIYIRRGLPIELTLKAETSASHTTTHYIWRTANDDKVRPAHAANEGKIFGWGNPPPTEHPGEDYNCRCTAEPYTQGTSEFAYQELTSDVSSNNLPWDDYDFARHFLSRDGSAIDLQEIGNLPDVIEFYLFKIVKDGDNIYQRLNAQIVDEARKHQDGQFSYAFDKSYEEFRNYIFGFGSSTIGGTFTGNVRHKDGQMYIEGRIDFYFKDTYADPLDIREKITTGTSDPEASMPWLVSITDGGGTYFSIHASWHSSFKAEAKLNKGGSRYR